LNEAKSTGTQIAAKQRLSVSEINKEADIKDKEYRKTYFIRKPGKTGDFSWFHGLLIIFHCNQRKSASNLFSK